MPKNHSSACATIVHLGSEKALRRAAARVSARSPAPLGGRFAHAPRAAPCAARHARRPARAARASGSSRPAPGRGTWWHTRTPRCRWAESRARECAHATYAPLAGLGLRQRTAARASAHATRHCDAARPARPLRPRAARAGQRACALLQLLVRAAAGAGRADERLDGVHGGRRGARAWRPRQIQKQNNARTQARTVRQLMA